MRVATFELTAALTNFEAALAIRERLVQADPSNAGWQRDLSFSLNKIGDVRVKQGQLAAALASFQAALAISEKLVQTDPDNVAWQRDVLVSWVKIADTDPTRARSALRRAYDVAMRLREEGRLAQRDAWMIDMLARRLAKLPP